MNIGDVILLNKKYFADNIFISQYFPNMQPAVPYSVEAIEVPGVDWGITQLKDIKTGEVFDISTVPELEDYWALVDEYDSYRVVPEA